MTREKRTRMSTKANDDSDVERDRPEDTDVTWNVDTIVADETGEGRQSP